VVKTYSLHRRFFIGVSQLLGTQFVMILPFLSELLQKGAIGDPHFGTGAEGFLVRSGFVYENWLGTPLSLHTFGAASVTQQLLTSLCERLFRPFGALSVLTFCPRLAPWAAFFRRFAAGFDKVI